MPKHHEHLSLRVWGAGRGMLVVVLHFFAGAVLPGQDAKPAGERDVWQKHLDELTKHTEQSQRDAPIPGAPAAPPTSAAPVAVPLFEDDFDRAGGISYVQHRAVLMVFAPPTVIDAWRANPALQAWSQRAVVCPINEGAQGDRASRLAKAFGIDPAQGGVVTALVRAPDGVKQVTGDQLLYQVLGRHPAPRDAVDVLNVLQLAVTAYEGKRAQYSWEAVLTGADVPSATSAPAMSTAPSTVAPAPVIAAPAPGPVASVAPMSTQQSTPSPVPAVAKPAEPILSPFESAAVRAWRTQRPIMFIFPGPKPFDTGKCAQSWKSIPEALAPELVVLTPGSADGTMGGRAMDWEAFFDVGGNYPTALMALPDCDESVTAPKASDLTYRVIARRQGPLTAEHAPVLARLWMSEDLDAAIMRAWVFRRPLLLVFPDPEHERELLGSPMLAKLEGRLPVYVNTKDAVSGIRRRTAAQVDKEFATEGVQRAEVVLLRLESKSKDRASVRLDQIQPAPINRAFAKKTPDSIFDWISSRVPPK